ncbi:hypothetical protein HBI70_148540 [Parastagonospora nodorum]|nr:hypothetical protein HBI70_148540 [Parastagonospora nodorum]
MHAGLRKELEARHSLLNLSVYNLSVYAVFKYLASSSNLSITIRCYISSLIYTKQVYLYADKYSKKYLKVCEADALKQVDINVREEENKNCSSLYYSNSNSNTAIRKTRIKASQLRKVSKEKELAKTKKKKREKENKRIIKLLLIGAYILYFKELLSNNSRIFASVIGITKTQAIKNKIVAIDSVNSTLCDLSNLLVIRFCIFSNPALENIGILTNKEIVEMQTNTATALANKLTAINKLVRLQTFTLKILEHVEIIILEANTPAVHSKATKYYSALLVVRFIIVYSFRKVDKHVFKAYNTISRQTIFNKFYNCKLEGIIIAKFY